MRRRFISAVLLAVLFTASGAVPLVASLVGQVAACCLKSAHSCCRRHSAGRTAITISASPDCASGCSLGPGVISDACLFGPQSRAAFERPARVDGRISDSQPRFSPLLSLSFLYQRPPPSSL